MSGYSNHKDQISSPELQIYNYDQLLKMNMYLVWLKKNTYFKVQIINTCKTVKGCVPNLTTFVHDIN